MISFPFKIFKIEISTNVLLFMYANASLMAEEKLNKLFISNSVFNVFFLIFLFRAEELETALMEMVKQDNRRLLSAKVI